MEFKNKVKMSLEDWQEYKDDKDISTALAHVVFLSTKPNSHKHIYTEEVIRQYAPSYLGKWVVSGYSEETMDSTTHVGDDMKVVGHIPANQEIQYTTDSEGYFQAGVDVLVAKLYANDVYEAFKRDGEKAVSVEQLVGFTEETQDLIDGVDEKVILGFEGVGICILGNAYNPSVPTANIKLVEMSEVQYEADYVKYSQIETTKEMSEVNINQEILNKLEEIDKKLSKEETMANIDKVTKYAVSIGDDLWSKIYNGLKEKYPLDDDGWITSKYRIVGIYEEGTEKFTVVEEKGTDSKYKIPFTLTEDSFELSSELIDGSIQFVEKNKMEMFTNDEFVEYEGSLKTEVESEEVEMSEEDGEVVEDTKSEEVLMSEELVEANAKIEKYETELEELRAFKMEALKEKCDELVEKTMSAVRQIVDEEDKCYETIEAEAKECTYETVEAWSNKTLASLTKQTIAKMEEISSKGNEGILEMGIPTETKKTKSTNWYE